MEQPITAEEMLSNRLAGVLPTIDIAGSPFVVDWRLKELRSKDDFSTRIDLGSMAMTDDGGYYVCFYNLNTKAVVSIPDTIIRLPEQTVMLKIPNELTLDPVAVARQYGEADTFLLANYPLQPVLKAEVVPLSQTGLPGLIQANRKRLSRPARRITKKNKGKGFRQ